MNHQPPLILTVFDIHIRKSNEREAWEQEDFLKKGMDYQRFVAVCQQQIVDILPLKVANHLHIEPIYKS